MNFAYLDTRSLFESVLPPLNTSPIDALPYDLDNRWKSFEKELGEFKNEFAKARIEYIQKHTLFTEKSEELNLLKMMIDNILSEDLKQKFVDILDKHESEEGISALTQQCREAAGKVEAMKKVMHDTNAERYAKFTCFVCMDRLVDLCFDPCGHVICERCWTATRTKTICPGCRTRTTGARKIFTMN